MYFRVRSTATSRERSSGVSKPERRERGFESGRGGTRDTSYFLGPRTSGRAIGYIALVVTAIAAVIAYCSYRANLAVVRGGFTPGVAASDVSALIAALKPLDSDPGPFAQPRPLSKIEEQPGVLDLERQGRIFIVDTETKCRVVRREWSLSCQTPSNHPLLVRLLGGRRAGSTVWMCSDAVRLVHPPL